ncbi:MAG: helicase-associated domain-containing protein [Anaerolineae bacterium]
MPDPLDHLLDSYNVATLNSMAVEAGLLSRKGPRGGKVELVNLMKRMFFTQERVQASLARLDPRERGVLNRLQLRGGTAPTRSLQREAVRRGLASPPPIVSASNRPYVAYVEPGEYIGSPDKPNSTVFQDIVARLTLHGLVFSRPESAGYGYNYKLQFHPADQLFIPSEVARYLPPPPPDVGLGEDWQPPHIVTSDTQSFLRDLYLYWDFVRRAPIALLANGMVGKRSLKAINAALLAPDASADKAGNEREARRLYLLRRLLQSFKLLEAREGRLIAVGTDSAAAPPFFALDTTAQLTRCIEVWLALDESEAPLTGEVSRAQPQVKRARPILLKTLAVLPPDKWFDLEEMTERLRAADTNFLFSNRRIMEQNYRSSYYYGSSYRTTMADMVKQLDKVELDFTRAALSRFLFDTGIVELGYAEPQAKVVSFARVGETGARILPTLTGVEPRTATKPLAPAPEDTHEGRVVLQPNFQILALGPVKLEILARLDLFADRRKADPNAFEYHLSRDSVYRAQQTGFGVAEIAAFLREVSGAEIPQNVQRTLDEWGAHHERIVFCAPVALLQASDEASLAALLARPDLAPLLRPVGPATALADAGGADLLNVLLATGLFPAVAEVDPASADHSAAVDDDGRLRPVHAVPSLFLEQRLGRVAEGEDGAWRVTEGVVRRAGTGRDAVLAYVAELERLVHGPLPRPLVERIRRWGGYYGDAAIETLTLVELRDGRTLDELREDDTLRELLTPFPAGERALAVIPTERLAEVETRLAALGVAVRRGLTRDEAAQ